MLCVCVALTKNLHLHMKTTNNILHTRIRFRIFLQKNVSNSVYNFMCLLGELFQIRLQFQKPWKYYLPILTNFSRKFPNSRLRFSFVALQPRGIQTDGSGNKLIFYPSTIFVFSRSCRPFHIFAKLPSLQNLRKCEEHLLLSEPLARSHIAQRVNSVWI